MFERNGHFFDLFLLQRLYVEFAHFAANMLIMVDKAEHTPFRMILEAICYPGKCFFMKRGVVFLISLGYPISARKDKNQRDICNCIESIDIGTYESCLNGCIYCYAIKGNYNTAGFNNRKHDKNSPMLIGNVVAGDVIKDRLMKSLRDDQLSLF